MPTCLAEAAAVEGDGGWCVLDDGLLEDAGLTDRCFFVLTMVFPCGDGSKAKTSQQNSFVTHCAAGKL